MRTIGIIGAGRIGQALARTALRAGREAVIANSRGPDSLAPGGGRSRRRFEPADLGGPLAAHNLVRLPPVG